MLFGLFKRKKDDSSDDNYEDILDTAMDDDEDESEYDSEDDYMDSLKQDDSYHFSFPFEYIKCHLSDGDVETETAYMEIDMQWSDSNHGYIVTHHVPNMYDIDSSEGNSDEDDIYEYDIRPQLEDKLDRLGIPASAIYFGY